MTIIIINNNNNRNYWYHFKSHKRWVGLWSSVWQCSQAHLSHSGVLMTTQLIISEDAKLGDSHPFSMGRPQWFGESAKERYLGTCFSSVSHHKRQHGHNDHVLTLGRLCSLGGLYDILPSTYLHGWLTTIQFVFLTVRVYVALYGRTASLNFSSTLPFIYWLCGLWPTLIYLNFNTFIFVSLLTKWICISCEGEGRYYLWIL